MLFSPILVLASIAGAALADPHGAAHFNRHHEIAKRDPGTLSKRFNGSRWSWYDAGRGACGEMNVASDYIVALNAAQFGGGYPGPNCFKFIQMTWGGKSVRAQIMDMCPGCPYGGLDLSKGLFQAFADLGKGIIPDGSWEFVDGSGSPPKPPPPPPKTTHKPKPPPPTSTYVWTPPKTTSKKKTTSYTPAPAPTTSKTKSKTSSIEKETSTNLSLSALPSSSSKPSVSSTPSATPTGEEDNVGKIGGVVPTGGAQQVYAANEAVVDTGRFFAAAALLV